MPVGKLKRVPIRNVWKNEEKDFTPWLHKNLDVLGDILGIELSSIERECATNDQASRGFAFTK